MPTERKSLKVIERYTRELVRQSVIGIDAVLQNRLVKVVSDALDLALLLGDGDDDSITGLVYQDDVQETDLDVSDADSLLDAIVSRRRPRSPPTGGSSTGQTSSSCASSKRPPTRASICSRVMSPPDPPTGCSVYP